MSRRTVLALAATLAVLSACFSPHPATTIESADLSEADVVGEWRNVESGAVLLFAEDGSFSTRDFPHQMYQHYFPDDLPRDFDPAADKLAASGEWVLDAPLGNPSAPSNTIILRVHTLADTVNRTSFDLRAEEQDRSSIVLAFYIGDPDLRSRLVYERCQAKCPTATQSKTDE